MSRGGLKSAHSHGALTAWLDLQHHVHLLASFKVVEQGDGRSGFQVGNVSVGTIFESVTGSGDLSAIYEHVGTDGVSLHCRESGRESESVDAVCWNSELAGAYVHIGTTHIARGVGNWYGFIFDFFISIYAGEYLGICKDVQFSFEATYFLLAITFPDRSCCCNWTSCGGRTGGWLRGFGPNKTWFSRFSASWSAKWWSPSS